jgi:hypothetical protein
LATGWGQTVEFSRILIHLNALKATPNISEHKHLRGGIEPLKLAFPAQVTYSVNQVSIQFQLHKLTQEDKIAIRVQKVGRLVK